MMSGLNNISISRMKRAWTEVLPEQMQLWDQLNAQMSTASNYKKYRTAIAELETGYIPFTGASVEWSGVEWSGVEWSGSG